MTLGKESRFVYCYECKDDSLGTSEVAANRDGGSRFRRLWVIRASPLDRTGFVA